MNQTLFLILLELELSTTDMDTGLQNRRPAGNC